MKTKTMIAALSLWCCLLAFGWLGIARYGAKAGSQAIAPNIIPEPLHTFIQSSARTQGTNLFVVLHPQCSCSRATVHELARVLGQAGQDAPQVFLLMYHPSHLDPSWKAEGILPINSLKGAVAVEDQDGKYAEALRAETSGEIILYSSDGRLLYQGGVTASRGHEGRSAASDQLLSAIHLKSETKGIMSVFGCSIFHRRSESGTL